MKYGPHEIVHPSRVVIRGTDGVNRTGRTNPLLFFPDHLILNMGGPHGTPGYADENNIVAVYPGPAARKILEARAAVAEAARLALAPAKPAPAYGPARCGICGDPAPRDRSCGCFDNGSE